jgi:transcriptional regulator with XRE-family HTH domain
MPLDDAKKRVARVIRIEMEKRGMTRADLAYCWNVSERIVASYLRADRDPDMDELRPVADLFEITPAVFMSDEDLFRVSDMKHGYRISPIDFGFRYLRRLEEFRDLARLEDLAQYEGLGQYQGFTSTFSRATLERFDLNFEAAKRMAADLLWEGDFREGPFVMPVLVELEVGYAFVWKQENNGSTFVISPVPLPYVEHL